MCLCFFLKYKQIQQKGHSLSTLLGAIPCTKHFEYMNSCYSKKTIAMLGKVTAFCSYREPGA